jgi:hypothetical protein
MHAVLLARLDESEAQRAMSGGGVDCGLEVALR